MPKMVKLALTLIIISLLFNLNGCWDAKEFDRFALVKGIAIDQAREKDRIKYSIQVIAPSPGGGGNRGEPKQSAQETTVFSATGYSVYEANRNLIKQTGKRPFYGQSELIIIGEELARKGIAPYLDYFLRNKEIRGRSAFIIADGEADKYLRTPHGIESVPASGIKAMVNGISVSGTIITVDLIKFLKNLLNDTTDSVAARIELHKGTPESGQKKSEQKQNLLFATGGAMFKDDQLVDWLTRKEARGVNWILAPDEIRGPILINNPAETGRHKIAVEITKTESKVKPILKNKRYKIQIKIKSEGYIIEDMSRKYDISREENIKQLNKHYSQVIENEIINALKKSRKYRADIFCFSKDIEKKYPREFRKIKENWEQIYAAMPIEIDVRADIRRAGMIKKGIGNKIR